MRRAGISLTTILAVVFQAAAAARLIDPESFGELWQVEAVVQEHSVVYDEDGSTYVGGSWAGGGCPTFAKAFLKKLAADGTLQWQLGGASPGPGECWNEFGDPLIARLSSVDEAFVVFSSLHGIALDRDTGLLGITGEVLLAWQDAALSRTTTARGAFAALVTPVGEVVGDAFLGTVPDGPPLAEVTCEALCGLGEETRGAQFGGRDAAFAPGRKLAVTGFHVPASSGTEPLGDTSYFIALFDRHLGSAEWIDAGGTVGHDGGLGIAANDSGEILVVGYGGLDRDLLFAIYRMDGTLERLRYATGPMDDTALGAESLADRHWVVTARITGQCTVDGQTLGETGQAQLDAVLELDSDLQLVASELSDPFPSKKSERLPATGVEELGGMIEPPDFVDLAEGELGTGGADELGDSDGYRLRAIQDSPGAVRLRTFFQLPREPMVLEAVAAEIHTAYCYTATFRMRHLDSGDLVTLAEKDVCPGGQAELAYVVPEEQSRALGIDGSEVLPMVLTIDLEIRFRAAAPLAAKSAGSTKDVSVDQIKVKVDYAE